MEIADIPKLYTALAEWMSCLVFVLICKRRRPAFQTAAILSVFLLALCVLQHFIGMWPVAFWIPAMAAAMVLMFLCIWSCCELTFEEAVLCFSAAFMTAEFIASFEWQIYAFLIGMGRDTIPNQILSLFLFYGGLFAVLYLLGRRYFSDIGEYGISGKAAFGSLFMTIAVFLLSNISYAYPHTPFSGTLSGGLFYIRTLVDFSGVLILFIQQERWKEMMLAKENDALNSILHRQYEHYQLSKESIEILNQKYHDLKHQIAAIRAEEDIQKRERYLKEMEEDIRMYEAQNKTGNSVLDTILTGKHLYCMQHHINVTCVADGNLLNFISVMDICTIFGNALDNAIESVEKLEDVEKRLIQAAVYSQNKFLIIRFENYCELALKAQELLPATTKKNKDYHGYGLKSIRRTVEKYGGTMTIRVEDNWFKLQLLIPLSDR